MPETEANQDVGAATAALTSGEAIEWLKERTDTIVLSFSRGKDSIAAWLRYRKHFKVLPFHLEVVPEPGLLLDQIRALGKKAGLAINPDKPVDWFTPHLKHIDLALCMTVFPGFGGQKFIPESLDRIRRLRELIAGQHPGCELEVDGGIDSKNAAHVVQAGANVLVVGTGIFGYPQGPAAALEVLRRRG